MTSYSFSSLNIKNSTRPIWRLTKITEDENVIRERGRLFCLAELTKADDYKIENAKSLVQFIFGLHASNWQRQTSTRPADNLETLLEETNKKFTDISLNLPRSSFFDFSIIIGLLHQQNLILSSHGKLQAWLIHPSSTEPDKKYRLVNILAGKITNDHKNKLFDQIVTGQLSEKQSFFLTTDNLWQYFNQDKIKDLILNTNITSIIHTLTKMINQTPKPADVALIIAKPEIGASTEQSDIIQKKDYISPLSPIPQTTNKATSRLRNVFQKARFPSPPKAKKVTLDAGPTYTPRNKTFITNIEKILYKFIQWFKALPLKTRFIFIGALLLFIIFIQSLSVLYDRQYSNQLSQKFNHLQSEIRVKRDKALASLIYNDRERARTMTEEALTLAYNLPEAAQLEINEKQNILDTLNKELDNINNVNNLDYLAPLITLQDTMPHFNGHIIATLNDNILMAQDNDMIVIINLTTHEVNTIQLDGLTQLIKLTAWDQAAKILYLVDENNRTLKTATQVSGLDTLEKMTTEPLDINLPEELNLRAIAYYFGRLYFIDVSDGFQLKKINLRNNQTSDWLGVSYPEITSALDLDIDGNIYILEPTTITRFFKGERTDWQIKGLEPVPKNLTQIIAKPDSVFIYLIDKDTRRFIILNKEGEFIKQLTSANWDNLTGITVDETNGQVYLLNGQDIYNIPIDW